MATKTKKPVEIFEIEGETLDSVSYATYYCRQPLFTSFKIFNRDTENATDVTVRVKGSTALIVPAEIHVEEIPHESSVEVVPQNILNPKYLAEIEEPESCTVQVELTCGKDAVCTLEADVQALPIDCWCGLSGNVETLASFVRPKIADCQKILAEAGLQLKTWGYSSEFAGYSGTDKNGVRNAVASVFSAIRRLSIDRGGDCDLSGITSVGDATEVVKNKTATPLELAVFAASCFEATKLNPVIIVGKSRICAGVWLYESCFSSAVEDDMQLLEKYITEGVNNLTLFDVEDLFAHRNASYTTSEAHAREKLQTGELEFCIDVKRCRIGGLFPLPLKVKTEKGYELLADRQLSFDEKPAEFIDAGKYDYDKGVSKEANWQRRLLDLSLKNNLLNFRYSRECLHLLCADLASFCEKIDQKGKFTLLANATPVPDAVYFGENNAVRNMAELIEIEMKSGKIRCIASPDALTETATTLIRKSRSAEEETGAKTLYLALGFLKWRGEDDGEDRYAPIALLPVALKRMKTQGAFLEAGEEYEVNTTLLEFLKRSFGIDVRGVEGKGLSPKEIIAVFRAKTANMKGWMVYEDVYLSQFTFARYAMWADVKNNIKNLAKNPLIASLMSNANKLAENKLTGVSEDDADPCAVLTPLPCDSAQYSAVAESAKGTTFVLHGPPGTGKSQTITNIIANAVDKGKRVLFVAEKQAALQVVKKRLCDIGIGDFCLELHSGKTTDKAEIIRNIETTLLLKSDTDGDKFSDAGTRIKDVRDTLRAPLDALHKKRRLGLSVYEGIVYYLQNKSAPELMNIESTFYDSLTKQKLEDFENMLMAAQAAAKECGGVYRSPFTEVRLTECDENAKRAVVCAAEVLLAEIKHLKNYLGLFLDTFKQKTSKFTRAKLENLLKIAGVLRDGTLKEFFECDEEKLYTFYNANLRYDSECKHWYKHFKVLPDFGKFADDIEKEIDNWGENYRSSRTLLNVIKRINRCAAQPVKEKDELEWIKRALEIEKARERILNSTSLSSNFVGFGGINEKKREEFLKPLYALHRLCLQTFMDYNADVFNGVCCVASSGILKPLVYGLIAAAISFTKSADAFMKTIKADKSDYADADIFETYTAKCTSLIDNIDMLPAWCMYKATAKKLNESGLSFITDAMENGKISGKQILSSFRKNVYRNFIQTNIPADDCLSAFSANVLDESAANYSMLLEEFAALTREKIRADLISRLPAQETEGPLALELMSFQRQTKGSLRSLNLRNLFADIPELLKVVAPCMLMSPGTVSQYLPADPELFDIVIFDEASQIPTCEAVPSLARAKSAIIVGDPRQMPPTSFFIGTGQDDDHPEAEDLESVLEDCLALGIPEKHLIWHYRSKHESLIAFSNTTYYSSKLCTYPSPDALDSRIKLHYIENGVYERGGAKCNRDEAEALVKEVVRRLKDERLRRSSMGIVTFSTPQQVYVEKLLAKALVKNGLEEAAYEREEPLFIKNLENVQGDERDVILFSVCYGPDRMGRLSLNFGPLNQFGGWRRLNVAVSRAREEMLVFSSMRYSMIDLARTTSRGVAGLKAFLEFAEKGRTSVSVRSEDVNVNRQGIGKFIAEELSAYGYDCRVNVGVSDFKIDVGVLDPKNKHNFVLGILCDGTKQFSVKDRAVMQVQALKRTNWNVYRLYSINFFNNPKREIKKIKELLDKLTSDGKPTAINFKKPYRAAKLEIKETEPAYILSGENDAEIMRVIKAVVAAEEPVSAQFLMKRTLSAFGISKYGVKLESKLRALIDKCAFESCEMLGNEYYFKSDKFGAFDRYRVEEGTSLRSADVDYTPYDVISLVKGILLNRVSVYADELIPAVLKELKVPRSSDKLVSFVHACIDEGASKGLFIRSISDKISLA